MTEPFDESTEDRLRAVLRAEADSVTPSPDALERIRSRTAKRPFASWFGLTWLRPAAAVAMAGMIVGSVLLGTPQLREHVLPDSMTVADSPEIPAPASSEERQPDDGDEPPAPEPNRTPEAEEPEPQPAPPQPSGGTDPDTGPDMTMACSTEPTEQPQARGQAEEDETSDACQDQGNPEDPGTDVPGGGTPGTTPPPETPAPEPEPSSGSDPATGP